MKREYNFNTEVEVTNILDFIKQYFANNGNPDTKAVIGISGGKDSTIAAMLLTKALGANRVIGVMMPDGEQKDINDAREVCAALGIKAYEINIKDTCEALFEGLNKSMFANSRDRVEDIAVVYTNVPPRVRMSILYGIAGATGGRVINTSNRSERYVGYCTKYGDLSGDVALFWDYCVEEVYKIGHEIAKDFPKMPVRLITKTPDDGLSGMTDEEKLGFTYEELDDYLLRDIYPEAKVLHNITNKHRLAEHKMNIHLRYPSKKSKGDWEF